MENLQINMENIVSNPITYGVIAIFLGMYGPRLHPKLPKPVKDLFNVPLFRFSVIALIIYMSTRDITMSLIITIAFLIVLSIANSQDMEEEFLDRYREGFSQFDMIKENFDNSEEFQEGPETFANNEDVEGFEDEPETFEDEPETFEDEPETFEEDPETFEEDPETFEEDDMAEGFANYNELLQDQQEDFTPYERHLNNVVNKYKFGN
jgi:hypothetical protein